MRRGDYAAYVREPVRKLLIISEPYEYGDKTVVTARSCERSKKARQFGLYALDALRPWEERGGDNGDKDGSGRPGRVDPG